MIPVILYTSIVVLLDALSKLLAARLLPAGESVTVLGRLMQLQLTKNYGMALGMLSGNTLALLLLPLAVIVAGYFMLRRYQLTPYKGVSIALILGGFLGNFLERILRGYVLDMIYFPFMPWFVCNVADIAICAGVVMMAVSLLFRPNDWRMKHAKDEPDLPKRDEA